MTLQEWIGIIGGVLGILGVVCGGLLYYTASRVKTYAAQRDFEHLKRNYEQLSKNIEYFVREQDRNFDRVVDILQEIKILLGRKTS